MLDPSGTTLAYATYLGGSRLDYCLGVGADRSGNVYTAGLTRSPNFPMILGDGLHGTTDAFVAKWDTGANRVAYSLLIGGSGDQEAWGLAIDAAQHIYIQGATNSTDFPTTGGAFQIAYGGGDSDAFLVKIAQ
jgi:hypothetical protein